MHKHHRKLRSQGGTDSPANIMHVTPEFHEWIHANPARSYELGFLVKSHDDPKSVFLPEPSMSAGVGYWRLSEDGWKESVPVRVGEPSAQSGAGTVPCPRCKGSGKAEAKLEKLEKPRQRKTLGIRLPVDADENGIEVLETLLSAARDELKETMGWKENVGVYFVIVAVLHDWLTGRVSAETA